MPFTPPDPTQPPDSQDFALGAAAIRQINSYLLNFLGVSFNMTTGAILAAAVPNGLPTPYGAAGTVLTSAGAGITPVWSVPGNLIPGIILGYGGVAAPGGWLICDGSTPLIATYPALAAVLGTTFGGNGTTTFGLPDLRGRTMVGLGTGTGGYASNWTLGLGLGEEQHLLSAGEMPAHTHSFPWAQYSGQHQNGTQPAGVYPVVTGVGTTNSASTGGGAAHNNLQPSIGINHIIKT